jgi:hypothetical protein
MGNLGRLLVETSTPKRMTRREQAMLGRESKIANLKKIVGDRLPLHGRRVDML